MEYPNETKIKLKLENNNLKIVLNDNRKTSSLFKTE